MPVTIGEPINERDENGRLKVNIATVFPKTGTIVTAPPHFHALQRLAYLEGLKLTRQREGLPPLSAAEEAAVMGEAVDLVADERGVFIRPNTSRMDLAVAADEVLQEIFPKRLIRYLWVTDVAVRGVLKRRGESWRIYQPPTEEAQIVKTIIDSRTTISGGTVYYYAPSSGTRILTFAEFSRLEALPDEGMREQLREIAAISRRRNHRGCPEIVFFEAKNGFAIPAKDVDASDSPIRTIYQTARDRFRAAVPEDFRTDDLSNPRWRNRMFSWLMSDGNSEPLDPESMGLDPEFSMRVEWLPGARIDDGELILDPAIEEPYGPDRRRQVPRVVRGLILNIAQEFDGLEYVNVGKLLPSPRRNANRGGRHEVYLAQIKQRQATDEILQIIRMQKWGVAERLDKGHSLERAMVESEEYTEYILYRLLACRQLRMNSPQHLMPRKVGETYDGTNHCYRGQRIWTPYFLRDYIDGTSTDRMPARKLQDAGYAVEFARLFGQAAASNLILGRTELTGETVFDVGDEIVVEDAQGHPVEIAVTDHVGTFADWRGKLESRAPEYAQPVIARWKTVANPPAFAAAYLDGLLGHFLRIQNDYARNRRAFDTLFKHQSWSRDDGSLPSRWARVLERLAATDGQSLCGMIERCIKAGAPV
jgi:hypothetical protein